MKLIDKLLFQTINKLSAPEILFMLLQVFVLINN